MFTSLDTTAASATSQNPKNTGSVYSYLKAHEITWSWPWNPRLVRSVGDSRASGRLVLSGFRICFLLNPHPVNFPAPPFITSCCNLWTSLHSRAASAVITSNVLMAWYGVCITLAECSWWIDFHKILRASSQKRSGELCIAEAICFAFITAHVFLVKDIVFTFKTHAKYKWHPVTVGA